MHAPAPIHCPACAADRGVAIPAAGTCPHAARAAVADATAAAVAALAAAKDAAAAAADAARAADDADDADDEVARLIASTPED